MKFFKHGVVRHQMKDYLKSYFVKTRGLKSGDPYNGYGQKPIYAIFCWDKLHI